MAGGTAGLRRCPDAEVTALPSSPHPLAWTQGLGWNVLTEWVPVLGARPEGWQPLKEPQRGWFRVGEGEHMAPSGLLQDLGLETRDRE